MLFQCFPGGGISYGRTNFPSWLDKYDCSPCSYWWLWHFHQFSLRNTLVVAPINLLSEDNNGELNPLQSIPGGCGTSRSWKFMTACIIHAGLRLPISDVFHFYAQVANPLSRPFFSMVVDTLELLPPPYSSPGFLMVFYELENPPPPQGFASQ